MDWLVGSRNVKNHTIVIPIFGFGNSTNFIIVGVLDVGVVCQPNEWLVESLFLDDGLLQEGDQFLKWEDV